MIIVRNNSADINAVYSATGAAKGIELQAIMDAHDLKVGKVQDIDGSVKEVVLSDTTKLEAALAKSGFGADSLGLWFAKVGERQARLDTDCALGKAGEVVSVPEIVAVPIPRQLVQRTALKRYQQA